MEWISVDERLPEDNGYINSVLFYSGCIRYGYLDTDGWRDETDDRFSPHVSGVTHWMPLPAPPKPVLTT